MKPFALIPLFALLVITGCTYVGEDNGPADVPVASLGAFNTEGLNPAIHQNLTPEENALLDAGKTKFEIGDSYLTMVPAVVTGSDGKDMNDKYVRGRHIRIVVDTSSLPYTCSDLQHVDFAAQSTSNSRKAKCSPNFMVAAAPADESRYESIEASLMGELPHRGRNVIEFDSIYDEKIEMYFSEGNDALSINALTGESEQRYSGGDPETFTPKFLPTMVTTEPANITPAYVHGAYSLTVGASSLTKKQDENSILIVPLAIRLSGKSCESRTGDCQTLLITTKKKGQSKTYASRDDLMSPADLTGTLSIDDHDFDEAQLHVIDRVGDEASTITIDLVTGAVISK